MKPSAVASSLVAATVIVLGTAGIAAAKRPTTQLPPPIDVKPPACGVTALPLVVGSEWVYEPAAPPEDRVLTDAQKRLTPLQPKRLAIKVTAIDAKDGVTTVSLSEDLDGRTHATWIKCTAGGATFQMSPDSFWFAGEAGPAYGIELSNIERKGQTLGLTGGKITALEWHDDLIAAWKVVPTGKVAPPMPHGKVDVNRHWVVQPDEEVSTKAGRVKAKKLGVEVRIKSTPDPAPVEPPGKEPPPLMVNFLWYVDGVGPVQVLNSFGQMYVLTSAPTR